MALAACIEHLEYEDESALSLLWDAIMELAKQHMGLKKHLIHNIFSTIFDVPGFLDQINSSLGGGQVSAKGVGALITFLMVVVSADVARREHPAVKPMIRSLTRLASPDQKAQLKEIGIQGLSATAAVHGLVRMQPQHDNDFPDDFKKISVFPTVDELNAPPSSPEALVHEWRGDPGESTVKYLDRQFRLLREDMVHPLKEEINEHFGPVQAARKPRLRFPEPRVCQVCAKDFCPPYLEMTFGLPNELKAKLKDKSPKQIQEFLKDEGERNVLGKDSIVLFIRDRKVVHIGVIVFREPAEMMEGDVQSGVLKVGVCFRGKQVLERLLRMGSNPVSEYAIQVRTSIFSHEPVLNCLRGKALHSCICFEL